MTILGDPYSTLQTFTLLLPPRGLSLAPAFALARHFAARTTGFAQADRDRLLAARHLLAGPTGPQRPRLRSCIAFSTFDSPSFRTLPSNSPLSAVKSKARVARALTSSASAMSSR